MRARVRAPNPTPTDSNRLVRAPATTEQHCHRRPAENEPRFLRNTRETPLEADELFVFFWFSVVFFSFFFSPRKLPRPDNGFPRLIIPSRSLYSPGAPARKLCAILRRRHRNARRKSRYTRKNSHRAPGPSTFIPLFQHRQIPVINTRFALVNYLIKSKKNPHGPDVCIALGRLVYEFKYIFIFKIEPRFCHAYRNK